MQKQLMRKHILEKCIELFSGAQTDRLTMEEIAHYCSITKPTLYSYFKNKEAILFALFNEISDKFLTRLKKFYAEYRGDKRSWDCFENMFNEIMAFFQSYRQIILMLMRETHKVGSGDDVDEHISLWLQKRAELMGFFEEILTPQLRPKVLRDFGVKVAAIAVFQVVTGILTELFFSEQVNVQQYTIFLKELLQNGIFNKEAR